MPLNGARLADYCGAPASVCEIAGRDCGKCESLNKKMALERFQKGAVIMDELSMLDPERRQE